MKIIPIAAESMGTRSTATFIDGKCKILIDPSSALALRRFGLPPHRIEIERKEKHISKIIEYAKKADVIVVTHYHYDHHNPGISGIFKDKIAVLKHPSENINYSQRWRAKVFIEKIEPIVRKLEYSDGKEFSFKGMKLRFSEAVPHGPDERLGYVTMVSVKDSNKGKGLGLDSFLYTSDVEGMPLKEHFEFAMKEDAKVVYCDGPLYEVVEKYKGGTLRDASRNMNRLLRESRVDTMILEHHLLRDRAWKKYVRSTLGLGKRLQKRVITAAEYAGKKVDFLEMYRKELFGRE
ncbi:MAG: MBL fold metallo-hydrolase [Thermoplasmata archaeon]